MSDSREATDERIRERARALLGRVLFDLQPDALAKLYASMSDPIWADGKHCGDCTKQPMSCNRCFVEDIENWLPDVAAFALSERDAAREQWYKAAEDLYGTHVAIGIRSRVAAQGEK